MFVVIKYIETAVRLFENYCQSLFFSIKIPCCSFSCSLKKMYNKKKLETKRIYIHFITYIGFKVFLKCAGYFTGAILRVKVRKNFVLHQFV